MSVYPSNQQISNKKERKDKKRNRVALAPEAVPPEAFGVRGRNIYSPAAAHTRQSKGPGFSSRRDYRS